MGEPKKILVAEDDPGLNRLISFKLGREGYRPLSVFDGKAALQAALEEDVEAVILDIMMPFLDGIQVLKRIRAANRQLPVIILSVKSREIDMHQALELGANDYMTKPFQPDELIEHLKQVLGEA